MTVIELVRTDPTGRSDSADDVLSMLTMHTWSGLPRLPRWAAQLIRLGANLAGAGDASQGQTVVIDAPTLSFAAPLIASGFTLSRYLNHSLGPHTHCCGELTTDALEPGTNIAVVPTSGDWSRARIGRIQQIAPSFQGTGCHVFIRADGGERGYDDSAWAFHEVPEDSTEGPLGVTQTFLLEALRGPDEAVHFCTSGDRECLVVGTKSRLEEEFDVPMFSPGLATGAESAEMSLASLARTDNCEGLHDRPRTTVASHTETPDPRKYSLLIVEGSASALDAPVEASAAHTVLVLDSCAARNRTEAVISVANERFGDAIRSGYEPITTPEGPIDMLAIPGEVLWQ